MRIVKVALLWIATSWVNAWPQEVTPMAPAEQARFEKMISVIQRTEVSKLDRQLPKKMALQDWLDGQVGPNVRMNWVVRSGTPEHGIPDCVEADANMSGGKIIIVWVAADHSKKRTPYVYRIDVVTGRDAATGGFQTEELDRLRDIPRFLNKLKQSS
jgi:hypothetical protein